MVTFLECPGPYSSMDITGNSPICTECDGSVSKPCPFNDRICSNHSKPLEQTPEQCTEPSCNCCLKSDKSENLKKSISCQYWNEHLADKNNSIISTECYNCPWCSGGFIIYRRDEEKHVKEDYQSPAKLDQKIEKLHCCNCNGHSRVPAQVCNPHTSKANKVSKCPRCPFVRQEVKTGYRCSCNKPSPSKMNVSSSKMNVSDTKTACKPVRSAIIIGSKMVNCGCNKRNGLQDECKL